MQNECSVDNCLTIPRNVLLPFGRSGRKKSIVAVMRFEAFSSIPIEYFTRLITSMNYQELQVTNAVGSTPYAPDFVVGPFPGSSPSGISVADRKIVSEFDKRALKIIRQSVEDLLRECARECDKPGRLLDIAPQDYEGAAKFFKQMNIETLDIDPQSKATHIGDITKRNEFLKSDSFDVVVCTEVLEHTLNPFAAVNEIHRILKPSGLAIFSVPFNFRIHGPLPDCWRFTIHGLKHMLSNFLSLDIRSIETQGRDLMPIHYTVCAVK
jgi:hypothetical protein